MNEKNMSQFNQKYTILLILTDGLITDIDKTIDEIVRGSNLPISIVIVGIGKGDPNSGFDQMEVLDGDENPLTSKRFGMCKRDIV